MTLVLYRLGRWSARRPFIVIGLWALAAAVVLTSSAAFGRTMEDSFEVPGVDSQQAVDLLTAGASDRAGITARVVAAPDDGATFAADPAAEADLARLRATLTGLDKVLDVSEARSPDGRVALLTVQYPVLAEMRVDDLDRLKTVLADADRASGLQAEAGGELFFNFEEPTGNSAELIGIGAAVVILLLAFGSLIAMGLPIGIALFGLVLGVAAMPLISHLIDDPQLGPPDGLHDRARGGHRLRPVPGDPPPRAAGPGPDRARGGGAGGGHRRPGRGLRRRDRGHRHPRPRRGRASRS